MVADGLLVFVVFGEFYLKGRSRALRYLVKGKQWLFCLLSAEYQFDNRGGELVAEQPECWNVPIHELLCVAASQPPSFLSFSCNTETRWMNNVVKMMNVDKQTTATALEWDLVECLLISALNFSLAASITKVHFRHQRPCWKTDTVQTQKSVQPKWLEKARLNSSYTFAYLNTHSQSFISLTLFIIICSHLTFPLLNVFFSLFFFSGRTIPLASGFQSVFLKKFGETYEPQSGYFTKKREEKKSAAHLNVLAQTSLTHVHWHMPTQKQTENGMGMFSAAAAVAGGNQLNGAH